MEWFRRAKRQLYGLRTDRVHGRLAQDFYTENNRLLTFRTNENRIAVAERFRFFQLPQFQHVSEIHIRHIGEAVIPVRTFQFWHMTAAVIGACSIGHWFSFTFI
jgi:hypothetical protein